MKKEFLLFVKEQKISLLILLLVLFWAVPPQSAITIEVGPPLQEYANFVKVAVIFWIFSMLRLGYEFISIALLKIKGGGK